MTNNIETIARVAYEAVRAYRSTLGDNSIQMWIVAPKAERRVFISTVTWIIENKHLSAQGLHEELCNSYLKQGWKLGPKMDADKKETPILVPWQKMPADQQQRSRLVRHIVHAFMESENERQH